MAASLVKDPPTKIGLICGTGLEKAAARFLENYTEKKLTTPFGQVQLLSVLCYVSLL